MTMQALAYPQPTLEELSSKDLLEMTEVERQRFYRLHKRSKIRQQNQIAAVKT